MTLLVLFFPAFGYLGNPPALESKGKMPNRPCFTPHNPPLPRGAFDFCLKITPAVKALVRQLSSKIVPRQFLLPRGIQIQRLPKGT